MKVKSFKLLPGVRHQGPDHELLHNSVQSISPDREPFAPDAQYAHGGDAKEPASAVDGSDIGPIAPANEATPADAVAQSGAIRPPKRQDVDTRKFKDHFVISVDGERYDPGHGIVCEVHQGLVHFIVDSKLGNYRPTSLLRTENTDTEEQPDPAKALDKQIEREAHQRLLDWMERMQERLKLFEPEFEPEPESEREEDGPTCAI